MNLEQLKQYFLMMVQTCCIIRDLRFGENKASNRPLCELVFAFCDVHYQDNPPEDWMLQHPFTVDIRKSGIGSKRDEI